MCWASTSTKMLNPFPAVAGDPEYHGWQPQVLGYIFVVVLFEVVIEQGLAYFVGRLSLERFMPCDQTRGRPPCNGFERRPNGVRERFAIGAAVGWGMGLVRTVNMVGLGVAGIPPSPINRAVGFFGIGAFFTIVLTLSTGMAAVASRYSEMAVAGPSLAVPFWNPATAACARRSQSRLTTLLWMRVLGVRASFSFISMLIFGITGPTKSRSSRRQRIR